MAHIIFPKRWTAKPPLGSQINWGHPLSVGLNFVLPLNEQGGVPRVLNKPATSSFGGAAAWINSPISPAINFPSTTDYFILGTETQLELPLKEATVVFIRRKTDATLRTVTSFGALGALGTYLHAYVPAVDGTVYWDFGDQTSTGRFSVASLAFSTREERWVFIHGPGGSSIWQNGVKAGFSSTVNGVRTASTANFSLNQSAIANGDFQDFSFFALYNKGWPDALAQWWSAEPYGMFVPQSPRVRYFVPPQTLYRELAPVSGAAGSGFQPSNVAF